MFVFFCFLFSFFCSFGHLTWLLNPPYFLSFVLFLFLFSFPFFAFNTKNCFRPRKGHFCLFLSVSLCFSLAFFWPSPFFTISLSLSLSLSLSCYFLFCSLLALLFAFFWFLVIVSFFVFLSSLHLFHS